MKIPASRSVIRCPPSPTESPSSAGRYIAAQADEESEGRKTETKTEHEADFKKEQHDTGEIQRPDRPVIGGEQQSDLIVNDHRLDADTEFCKRKEHPADPCKQQDQQGTDPQGALNQRRSPLQGTAPTAVTLFCTFCISPPGRTAFWKGGNVFVQKGPAPADSKDPPGV